ncbi:MAG TPA: FAD-dependent oxidoreductase [Solirubrobacteraceae bacterium]|nr:FAD-dependent oxidoreductase [Solirubrobacteraceae bacterium]
MSTAPLHVVVAGGGVAGLEALLALRALGGDRVRLTLVSAEADFVYRPLAVGQAFALGHPRRTPLRDAARTAGAELVHAPVLAVDADARTVELGDGSTLSYDALVLATGAASEPAYERATTWDDRRSVDVLGGLLRDLEEGYTRRLAIVVPPGPGWPLPAYELALLIAGQAYGMGAEAEITLVTPEQAPLAIFGSKAVAMMRDELERAGIALELGAYAEMPPGAGREVLLRPSGRRLDVERVLALPRLHGRAPRGIPSDPDGFLAVDPFCRVVGVEDVWAAGDGIAFPVKFGGLATEQADAAASDIAARAGAPVTPEPFRPVLRGQLLTPRTAKRRFVRFDASGGAGEGDVSEHALWWPPSKIAGRWLAPWLAEQDADAVPGELPQEGGLPVQADLHREAPLALG